MKTIALARSVLRFVAVGALVPWGVAPPPAACAEIDWDSVTRAVRALPMSPTGGEAAVLDALEFRARDVLSRLDPPANRATLERVAPALRRQLRASIGIDRLPPAKPRNVRVVAVLDRGSYVIEKLVYETFPNTRVPAHLYRPAKVNAKRPAVLFVPGHWWADSKARPDFQAFCINMARRGFVVLTYDPFGQGERGISFRDHRRTAMLLLGVAQQGIVVFESQCALAYLCSRPDVDPDRVGITGASGGGYNSWMMTALDTRIAASVPVVGTSEFFEQLHVCRPLDWYAAKEHCHFVPGLLRYANNHELLALAAPRPVLVVSAHNDESFPIPGIRQVVRYGEELYGNLGATDRFSYFEDATTGHGYQKAKREAAYGWFQRWLDGRGDGQPATEPETETFPHDAPELRCFPPGQNEPAGPGIIEQAKRMVERLPPPGDPPEPAEMRATLRQVLGIKVPTSDVTLRVGPRHVAGEVRIERLHWAAFDGLQIPAVLVGPTGPWRGAVLATADTGKNSLVEEPVIQAACRAGLAVILADVRGTGELAVTKPGWTFAVSLLLGESFVGRQALDLIAGRRALATLPALRGKPIGLLGSGPFASMAALYASVLDRDVAWLLADRGFVTYRSFLAREASMQRSFTLANTRQEATTGIDEEIPHALFAFDVLRRFDLPDLFASVLPRPVLVARPINGDWQPMPPPAIRLWLAEGRFLWPSSPAVAAGVSVDRKMREFIIARAASLVLRR